MRSGCAVVSFIDQAFGDQGLAGARRSGLDGGCLEIDNPSFTAEVVIKFSGTGSWTYTFPLGTDLLTLSGYYQLDENLNITFTAKAKTVHVVTLPVGGPGRSDANQGRTFVSAVAIEDQQSSLQQIRQQLQNLRTVSQ